MEIYSIPSLPSKFNQLQIVVLALIIAKGVASWGMTLLEVNAIVAYQTTWTPLWAASVNKLTKNQTATVNRDANQFSTIVKTKIHRLRHAHCLRLDDRH